MKCLGIQLNVSHPTSYWMYLMILITSCSILLHNTLVNFVSLITNLTIFWGIKYSATSKVDLIYNSSARVIDLVFLVGIPVAFTFLTRMGGRWKELWNNLLEIQQEMDLDLDFHRKCKRHCYIALFLLLAVLFWSICISLLPIFIAVSDVKIANGPLLLFELLRHSLSAPHSQSDGHRYGQRILPGGHQHSSDPLLRPCGSGSVPLWRTEATNGGNVQLQSIRRPGKMEAQLRKNVPISRTNQQLF